MSPLPLDAVSSLQTVGDLCSEKLTLPLYNRLVAACDSHVAGSLAALRTASPDAMSFLRAVQHVWESHVETMLQLRNIFLALDRELTVSSSSTCGTGKASGDLSASNGGGSSGAADRAGGVRRQRIVRCVPLWETGLALFRHHFCCAANAAVAKKTLGSLLALVEEERSAGTARSGSGASATEMCVDDGAVAPLLAALGSMYRQLELYSAPAAGALSAAAGVAGSSDSIAEITVSSWLSAAPPADAAPERAAAVSGVADDAAAQLFRTSGRAAARARELARWRGHVESISLEVALLESSAAYFAKEGELLLLGAGSWGAMDVGAYCRHVVWRRAWEARRCRAALTPRTAAAVALAIDTHMVHRHLSTLLGVEKGIEALFDTNARVDLQRVYRICSLPDVGGRKALLDSFGQYVTRRGRHLVAAAMGTVGGDRAGSSASSSSASAIGSGGGANGAVAAATSTLVVDLIAFRAKFSDIVLGAFGADRAFAKAARDALEMAVNAAGGEAPRLLAHFLDKVVRAPRSAVAIAARMRLAATPSQRDGDVVAAPTTGGAISAASSSSGGGSGAGPRSSGAAAVAASGAATASATTPSVTVTATTLEMDNGAVLGACIALFRLIDAKDVFEATCRSLLVKRLLLTPKQKAPNFEAEGKVVVLLKAECGGAFTAKMEGMVADVRTSAVRVEEQFNEWLAVALQKERNGTGLTPALRHATLRGSPSPTTTPSLSDGAGSASAAPAADAAARAAALVTPGGAATGGRGSAAGGADHTAAAALGMSKVSVLLCTVTFNANIAHNLTRSP
jgi:hypothetical protein